MSIVLLLVVLAVIAVIAVAAAGRWGSMPDAEPDRSPRGQLPPGDVTRAEVDGLRFSLGFRGYRMDEVDEVLDRLTDQLERRDARIAELEARPPAGDDRGAPPRGD
ncbi:MAG: DivIVA domain-containing protein [Actinomycetes bacterium]